MLTKQDINQIQNLLNPLHSDIKTLKTDVKDLKTDVAVLKTDVKKVKKIVEKDFDFHDRQNIKVIHNIQSIQKYIGLPIMDFGA